MQAGLCYWLVGAGDGGVGAFTITAWDPSDDRVGSDKSKTREALVQHCPSKTGSYKFEGKVARGAGHFAIGVFAKEAPEAAEAPADSGPQKADLEKLIAEEAAAVAPSATQVGNFYKSR